MLLPWQRVSLLAGKVFFTALISVQLAALTWMLVHPQHAVLSAPTQAKGKAPLAQQSIADWHLFGDASAKVVNVKKQVHAPDTHLRLELLGVLATNVGKNASAIIAPKGGRGEYYRVGDVVQGRTKLATVHADKVILDSNGKLETLKFIEKRRQTIRQSPTPRRSPSKSKQTRNSLKERFRQIRSAADAVSLIKSEVDKNPQEALSQLGLEPVSAGGAEGYKVSSSGSMLMQLGLQAGDIILSVNGQALGNMQDDQSLLEQVSSGAQMRLEIQRGNRRFVVNHTIQ